MPLTHFAIAKAVAKEKPVKLSDGAGLHLLVQPNGKMKPRRTMVERFVPCHPIK